MNQPSVKTLLKKRVKELEARIDELRRVADAGYALSQTIRRVRKPNDIEQCGVFTGMLDTRNDELDALNYMDWAYGKYVNPGIMRFP